DQVIDLKDAFEPIAMLKISNLLREMKQNQKIELRVYDLDMLVNINRLFNGFAGRLMKQEIPSGNEAYRCVIIQPFQQETNT
ncbi:MAG: hypothetical protein AB7S77_24800, partial [Desulfatirhabdiaceae bacterium]